MGRFPQCLRVIATIFFMLAPALAQAAANAAPVGLILESSPPIAQLERSGWKTPLQVLAGMAIFEGDRIVARGGTAVIAFCPERSLLTITGRVALRLDASRAEATNGAVSSRPLPLCSLPAIERDPVPRNIAVFSGNRVLSASSPERMARLPQAQRELVTAAIGAIEAAEGAPALLAAAAKAALFERQGLWDEALAEYRGIQTGWPDADWTRGVIARLLERQLTSATSGFGPAGEGRDSLFAFVVGISKYQSDRIEPLRYADRDATLFVDYLASPRGGGLTPGKNLWLLTNEMATRDRLTSDLAAFLQGKANGRTTLVIYLSGHGVYLCRERAEGSMQAVPCKAGSDREEPYLLAYDSDPEDAKVTAIRMADLYDLITSHADRFGKVLLYLDVCHSGALGALPLESNLTSPKIGSLFDHSAGDVGLMLASSRLHPKDRADEYAVEDRVFGDGHGLFTYIMVRAQNGDVEGNDQHVAMMPDLMEFVRTNVRYQSNQHQTPTYTATRPDIPVVADTTKPGIVLRDLIGKRRDVIQPRQNRLAGAEKYLGPDPRAAQYQAPPPTSRVLSEQEGQQIVLRYLKGEQLVQTQADFDQGARAFQEALDLAPDSGFTESRMLFCRGRSLIFSKRYSEAQDLLERALRIDPSRGYAFNALGIAYLEQSATDAADLPRAIGAFEDAIRLAPYWAYPVHNLALALEQTGAYRAAIEQYQKAMSMAPDASYPAYSLGLLYQRLNRFPEARQMYQTAIRIALEPRKLDPNAPPRWPNLSEGYNALGTLLVADRKFAAAEAQFRLALGDDPGNDLGNPLARHNLALLLAEHLRRFAEAESVWLSILKAEPSGENAVAVHLSLAEQLAKRGRLAEAIAQYRELLQAKPEFSGARRALSLLLVATGDPAGALKEIEQALRTAPNAALERTCADINRILQGREPLDKEVKEAHRRWSKNQ
jgi:tetratricopeptide (TPR) repeat protein